MNGIEVSFHLHSILALLFIRHYHMMDTTVPSEFCTYPYSPENNVPLLRNVMKNIFQTFKTVSPLAQLRDLTSLQEMIFSYSSCGEEEGWTVIDMTICSHNSVEDYDSKVVTVLLASMITSINAYLGYRRKKVIWGRALLDKDDLVLKLSSVIFSCYSFVRFSQQTLVPRGCSISVRSQTKSKIIFHGSPKWGFLLFLISHSPVSLWFYRVGNF